MIDLESSLAAVATTHRLLVAADFDGTLAPIVDLPENARADPEAVDALRAIGGLPDTMAAIVSGRARGVLARLLGDRADGIVLVGSHGAEVGDRAAMDVRAEVDGHGRAEVDGQAEIDDPSVTGGGPGRAGAAGTDRGAGSSPATSLSADQRELLDLLTRELEHIAAGVDGALIERKPLGVALHYRGVPPGERDEVVARLLSGPAAREGVRRLHGRKVVELSVSAADKGDALDRLRRSLDATAVIYIGDDVTDEDAFGRLGSEDLGVKVGSGPTLARARIDRQAQVADLLDRVRVIRLAPRE